MDAQYAKNRYRYRKRLEQCPICGRKSYGGKMHKACAQKTRADILQEALDFRMPFGKFKTNRLEDIPDYYIRWLSENCKIDAIATKADMVRTWREKNGIEIKNISLI